jgi:hypothetical protein
VFADRYHAEIITSPTRARHALAYVLLNWRKHKEDQSGPMKTWRVDWFSSAAMFPDWAEYGEDEWALWRGHRAMTRSSYSSRRPGSFRRAGRRPARFSCHDVPSARR